MRRKHKGFTLIEMLVVIAIITIIAGMLMPAIMMALKRARRVQCLNNEKQMGNGIVMFVQDNDGDLPGDTAQADPGAWSNTIAQACGQAKGAGSMGIFNCPTDSRARDALTELKPLGYGMNPQAAGKPLESIPDTISKVLIAESDNSACGGIADLADDRHDTFVNILFADMHAKPLRSNSTKLINAFNYVESTTPVPTP